MDLNIHSMVHIDASCSSSFAYIQIHSANDMLHVAAKLQLLMYVAYTEGTGWTTSHGPYCDTNDRAKIKINKNDGNNSDYKLAV